MNHFRKSKNSGRKYLGLGFLLLGTIFFFQNCSKGFSTVSEVHVLASPIPGIEQPSPIQIPRTVDPDIPPSVSAEIANSVICSDIEEIPSGYSYGLTCGPMGCDRQGGHNFSGNASATYGNGIISCSYRDHKTKTSSVEVGGPEGLIGYDYAMTCNPRGCDRQGSANFPPRPGEILLESSKINFFFKDSPPLPSDRFACQYSTETPNGFKYAFSCGAFGCDRQGGSNFKRDSLQLHCFYR